MLQFVEYITNHKRQSISIFIIFNNVFKKPVSAGKSNLDTSKVRRFI